MPPHLHPRSSATTTLFASTLAASFIIVGIPHIFPCPAPRRSYLDADGNVVRQRRRREGGGPSAETSAEQTVTVDGASKGIETISRHTKRPHLPPEPEAEPESGSKAISPSSPWTKSSAPQSPARTSAPESQASNDEQELASLFRALEAEAAALDAARRECPVPKPTGWIGDKLGFGRDGLGSWGRGRGRGRGTEGRDGKDEEEEGER